MRQPGSSAESLTDAEVADRIAGASTRGRIKVLGAEVDEDPALRARLLRWAEGRKVEVEDDWSGKRLVRALRQRQEDSRARGTPLKRDQPFICHWCGAEVPPGGARVRDHCPVCLRGRHVDGAVPGDRASDCGGVLEPVAFSLEGRSGVVIAYRCARCGHAFRARAHPDDAVPPSLQLVDLPGPKVAVSAAEGGQRDLASLDRARTLPLRVLDALRRHALWQPGERVILAVSGGLDSTVMMHLLAELQPAHKGLLEVVSLDHGLRPEAIAEVAQVGRQAALLGLPFSAARLDLLPGTDLYRRARDARRAALLALGAPRIATAHHQDDQAETVLQRLLRGAGSTGLRAMLPLDPPWCRPLLEEPRAVLQAWAELAQLSWSEDPSNARSQRGRLRALVDALDALHGGANGALARSARLLGREDAFLEELAEQRFMALAVGQGREVGLPWEALSQEHPALQLRLLRRLTRDLPSAPRADRLEAILRWSPEDGARIELKSGVSLVMDAGVLHLRYGDL